MRDPWTEFYREERRKRRRPLPGWLAAVATLAGTVILVVALASALTALSASGPPAVTLRSAADEVVQLRKELDDARGRLTVSEQQVDRMKSIAQYSTLYKVPSDLASDIYDIALAEGIHPGVAFQLVKVESAFKAGARSEKNAIGYTQLRLATARSYDSTVTEESLHDRQTNLRIGFRFLNDLMRQFDQDLHLALVAYNRGPTRVTEMIARGEDPRNGYSEVVLKGVKKG
jgi:soluble lytic murein transglycosylase-like protein